MRHTSRERRRRHKIPPEIRRAALRVEQASREAGTGGLVRLSVSEHGAVCLRCSTCGKVCYNDRTAAEAAVAKIRPDPMNAYYSKKCGWWHLATIKHRDTGEES